MPPIAADPALGAWLRRLPHYLYLVDLIPGKRVLEVGCGTGLGAQFLANHGAGRVVGVDRSPRKVNEARARYRQNNLEFRCEEPGAIELEDATFDCIFVPSGVDLLRRRSVLGELRRLLAHDGHLVVCGTSADRRGAPGGASFHEIRDRIERSFAPVRMIAQTPFIGFSLVEYGDDGAPLGVQLDTSLVELEGGEAEPCDYVAVCGGSAAALRDYTVVQLPEGGVAAVVGALGPRHQPVVDPPVGGTSPGASATDEAEGLLARELRVRLEKTIDERTRAQTQARELREQLEELRRQAMAAEQGGGDAARAEVSATERIAEAMAAHRAVVGSLEIAVEEGQAYAEELRGELEEVEARADRQARDHEDAERRAERLEAELRDWRTRASVAEGRLLRAGAAPDGAAARPPAEGGATVADLTAELARVRARAEAEQQARAKAARDNGGQQERSAEREVRDRVGRLEVELDTGRDLLRHIEDGLAELEKAASREAVERAPSAWAAHRDQQLRELASELGIKDAEITILHVGVTALRARLKELITEVRRAAGSMRGRSAAEMIDLIERLSARLSSFEERE